MAAKEACTFAVAVALELVRNSPNKDASHKYVKHLSIGEQNSFWRIVKAEFDIDKPRFLDEEEPDEQYRRAY